MPGWTCRRCGEAHEDDVVVCWRCASDRDGLPVAEEPAAESDRARAAAGRPLAIWRALVAGLGSPVRRPWLLAVLASSIGAVDKLLHALAWVGYLVGVIDAPSERLFDALDAMMEPLHVAVMTA